MSKLGSLGRGISILFSYIISTIIKILQNVAFAISLGVTVYTIGNYTRQAINNNKTILEIIYWRDPKRTGIVLGAILVGLFFFTRLTLLSFVAYGALGILGAAIGFRLYKFSESQIKKTDGSNPFKPYLEQEITVPQDRIHAQVDVFIEYGQQVFKHLRHLFLVESFLDSFKFGLLLYTLTYVGNWFSGISLLFIFIIALFSVPKIYKVYKEPIDSYISLAQEHLDKIQHTTYEKLPFLKKLSENEKKTE